MERTFISLFGGIGGFDLALTRHGWKNVWYNDYDKYAVQTYNKNFETEYEATDIREVDTRTIPDHSLFCAGFPCQSFSIAGKRKGFADTRGTLFFEICRIVKTKRPSLLLLENVKGLLSHDEGKTFAIILRCLDELGYDAEWQVLNSKHHGVPQNRERVFIVGHLRTEPFTQIFPLQKDATKIQGIYGEKTTGSITTAINRGHSETEMNMIANVLDANMHKGITPEHFFEKKKRNIIVQQNQQGQVFEKNVSGTIHQSMGNNQSPFVHSLGNLRRLTPIECERLQGFPDGWTKGVSDTQRYRQLGNAVTVNVIEAIVKRI